MPCLSAGPRTHEGLLPTTREYGSGEETPVALPRLGLSREPAPSLPDSPSVLTSGCPAQPSRSGV